MFKCERCGSGYSPMRAAAMDNCPRCQIRDRVAVPLSSSTSRLPHDVDLQKLPGKAAAREESDTLQV